MDARNLIASLAWLSALRIERALRAGGQPDIGEPASWCHLWFQMFGVAVFFHVSVAEGSLWVQEDSHVVVCVVAPPDAHAGCGVEAQVFPGTPEGRAVDELRGLLRFGVFACAGVGGGRVRVESSEIICHG